LKDATVVIQGFGNAGAIAAQLFAQAGARIIGVSDSAGGIASHSGLDIPSVISHKQKTRSVVGLPGSDPISNTDLLLQPCDILIPAALENQIRADNAAKVQARCIVEAANGPTTPAADRILFGRNIPVVPDILANAGGVTVSYYEWVQNVKMEEWELADIHAKLQKKMQLATDAVFDRQEELHRMLDALVPASHGAAQPGEAGGQPPRADLRMAAYVLALERVAKTATERGVWP
jgi:glutamate dehydrogenase (NAD(P)+)